MPRHVNDSKRQEHLKIEQHVEELVYLGATLAKDDGESEDSTNRLNKAGASFYNLMKIWRTSNIGKKTKIKLFKTLVKPVLLYEREAWKITHAVEKKMESFQFGCLGKILNNSENILPKRV